MLEWWAALAAGEAADAFLAVQGDQWDTQWDMACALIGAITALLLFSRLHDRPTRPPERRHPHDRRLARLNAAAPAR